jgi:hypothetical protein
MTTEPDYNTLALDYMGLVEDIRRIAEADIARTNILGEFNLGEAQIVFRDTAKLFLDFANSGYRETRIPLALLRRIIEFCERFINLYIEAKKLNLNTPNLLDVRDRIISNTKQFYTDAFQLISPLLTYLNYTTDTQKALEDLEKVTEATKAELETLSTLKKTAEAEITNVKEAVLRAEQLQNKNAVSKHSIIFQDEAIEYKAACRVWLIASVSMFVGLIFTAMFLAYFYFSTSEIFLTFNDQVNLQLIVLKIVVFTVLFYALRVCTKSYFAARHNYVVNKHRHNALQTFEAFVNKSSDDTTKNAVLLKATETIFSPNNTGYHSEEKDSTPNFQILEIIRNSGKPT